MKKKIWIRVLGVVALLAWVFTGLAFYAAATLAHGADRGAADLFGVFCAGVAGFLTAVWALFSIIDGFMRRQASLQGTALAQALAGRGAQPGSPAQWPTAAAPSAPQWPTCAFCRTHPAAWVCSQHQWPACLTCANAHLQTEPHCTYAPLAPAAPAPAPRPRAVTTSPLAGLR